MVTDIIEHPTTQGKYGGHEASRVKQPAGKCSRRCSRTGRQARRQDAVVAVLAAEQRVRRRYYNARARKAAATRAARHERGR